ncbi:hypothetical protein [Sphingomonas hankookensis]|uniref:hypothetical protein n=1 Tax=Sphingomonas hankookensis TaxID=563996 RepID=UPI003F78D74B
MTATGTSWIGSARRLAVTMISFPQSSSMVWAASGWTAPAAVGVTGTAVGSVVCAKAGIDPAIIDRAVAASRWNFVMASPLRQLADIVRLRRLHLVTKHLSRVNGQPVPNRAFIGERVWKPQLNRRRGLTPNAVTSRRSGMDQLDV